MGCCRCCTTTGACCNDGVCTEETCADCEDNGGVFQGVGTECSGEGSDECPCDPPSDPSLCEKCVNGFTESYCTEERPNCCDGTCQAEECLGACCDTDGTCSQTTLAGCDGVWQGAGTSCDDYDCESGCCEEVTLGTCTLDICRRGYNSDTCNALQECDPTIVVTPPTSGQISCKDGGPASSTVTGSGVTFNTGDPLLDADLDAMMNESYAISWECNSTHDGSNTESEFSYTGNYGPYTVRVTLTLASIKLAGIQVFLFSVSPPSQASMSLNDGAADVYSSECDSVYECDNFSGAPTSSGGAGNYSSANIAVT